MTHSTTHVSSYFQNMFFQWLDSFQANVPWEQSIQHWLPLQQKNHCAVHVTTEAGHIWHTQFQSNTAFTVKGLGCYTCYYAYWNSLDSETLHCSSISGFKRRLKTLLFRQAFSRTTWTVRQRLWSHPTCWRYTNMIIIIIISARQHAERAICYRPSVRPSVTRVDQSKTVELRGMQFSPYSSPIPIVFAG